MKQKLKSTCSLCTTPYCLGKVLKLIRIVAVQVFCCAEQENIRLFIFLFLFFYFLYIPFNFLCGNLHVKNRSDHTASDPASSVMLLLLCMHAWRPRFWQSCEYLYILLSVSLLLVQYDGNNQCYSCFTQNMLIMSTFYVTAYRYTMCIYTICTRRVLCMQKTIRLFFLYRHCDMRDILFCCTCEICRHSSFYHWLLAAILIKISPWYNRTSWLGVKHQLTYLLT